MDFISKEETTADKVMAGASFLLCIASIIFVCGVL